MTRDDTTIRRILAEIAEATAWPPQAVIDTAVDAYGLDETEATRVWREMTRVRFPSPAPLHQPKNH